jgi:hypothetical protein
VNECISKVRTEIQKAGACGEGYKNCLDFTGMYVDRATGKAIYKPYLFELSNQIKLENMNDPANKTFLTGLDDYRTRVSDALNTCRDESENVWTEFKREALIEIAQSQDRLLEGVKSSCITTIKNCYDAKNEQIEEFDEDEEVNKRTGARGARATAAMCADDVLACAALYSSADSQPCQFERSTGKIKNANNCGLSELLTFVNSTTQVKIEQGCDVVLTEYVNENCAPASGDTTRKVPYGCRRSKPGNLSSYDNNNDIKDDYSMAYKLYSEALRYCGATYNDNKIPLDKALKKVKSEMELQLSQVCYENNGSWVSNEEITADRGTGLWPVENLEMVFGNIVYGGLTASMKTEIMNGDSWGGCFTNSAAAACKNWDSLTGSAGHAVWNGTSRQCSMDSEWYKLVCDLMDGGYWEPSEKKCYYN